MIEDIYSLEKMRSFFESGRTRSKGFREKMLNRLASGIKLREREILDALRADLGKPEIEAYASELGFVLNDITYALKHLGSWMRPVRHRVPLILQPGRAGVFPEPLGVVLVIGPWNYPFQLILAPLISAIAAGNCAVIKPSEYAPNVSDVLESIFKELFDDDYVKVISGDALTVQKLQELPFNHIFFTGSSATGRKVMEAAAKQLIPVTLELGGKCPVIICEDADIDVAARRVVRGKFMNAGQTCVAPDHVWVAESRFDEFVTALKKAVVTFYGEDPLKSLDYGRLINERHFQRVLGYLEGESVVFGGECKVEDRYIAPTIVARPSLDSALMRDEIFGPVLPVLSYDSLDKIIRWSRGVSTPLALYVFSRSKINIERVVSGVPSGGVCVNDVVNHVIITSMPFGGVGASGMGAYHGRAGFDAFTHYRSILNRKTWLDIRAMYPPWQINLRFFKRIYRFLSS